MPAPEKLNVIIENHQLKKNNNKTTEFMLNFSYGFSILPDKPTAPL